MIGKASELKERIIPFRSKRKLTDEQQAQITEDMSIPRWDAKKQSRFHYIMFMVLGHGCVITSL